ncbi:MULTISPECIES: HD domain-containing protein [unclassified Methanosarcina]|uniref:HD domain-containing protein n=1 Tax=unclassified Methanosarcina TaxID=2644672 RepID=UPI000615D7DB|nr:MULTISPECIES: HD domain-containing protein [unclassified Methanosarcina]AKB18760.1 metal-dependent phosphohydrolase [Methanosarcina sp. WWM596]AKB21705.1 metal-dependent phosphohydrolase [Methanosarcina sp. WH1]
MQKKDLDYFRRWFFEYVNRFFSPDSFTQENIELKIEHTGRVCENILLLAKSEKIGENECMLAETIALFHDLGRFEQFFKYKTFKDSESENHAVLGVKILNKERVLSCLSEEEENLILKTVEYHNLMEIPGNIDLFSKLHFFIRLIRDADKIDILRLASEEYAEEEKCRNPALELYLPDTHGYSEPMVSEILNNRMAKIEDMNNRNDVKLLRLSWIFDINFPATFTLLKKYGYLEAIMYSLPEIKETDLLRRHIENYLNAIESKPRKI